MRQKNKFFQLRMWLASAKSRDLKKDRVPVDVMRQKNEFFQLRGRNFSSLIRGSDKTLKQISQDCQHYLKKEKILKLKLHLNK